MTYPEVLSAVEILTLITLGKYTVDTDTGKVYNEKRKEITPFADDSGYLFVRVYDGRKRKAISVSKVVWMTAANSTIPEGWEVHHRDEDVKNNAFSNLLCLHPLDHRKFHKDKVEEPIPF